MRRHMARITTQDPRIRLRPGDPLPHLWRADVCVHPTYEDGFAYAPMVLGIIPWLGAFVGFFWCAVTYTVAGLLKKTEDPLSSRSDLHDHILDALHEEQIESHPTSS